MIRDKYVFNRYTLTLKFQTGISILKSFQETDPVIVQRVIYAMPLVQTIARLLYLKTGNVEGATTTA